MSDELLVADSEGRHRFRTASTGIAITRGGSIGTTSAGSPAFTCWPCWLCCHGSSAGPAFFWSRSACTSSAPLGICVGFHRLLTHRSFACPRWLERTFVLLGTCCVMESPPYWVAVHRRHHQFADEEPDPHSPLKSFFWSHFGWYMVRIDPARRAELLQRYAKDVMRDPLYAFLEHNHNWVALIVLSWLAFFGIGWGAGAGAGHEHGGRNPVRRERADLGGVRAQRGSVSRDHVGELFHAFVGLPQLRDQRQQQEQFLGRDDQHRRRVAQQPSRRSALGPPRTRSLGARHRVADDPPAQADRSRLGRRGAVASSCRAEGRSRADAEYQAAVCSEAASRERAKLGRLTSHARPTRSISRITHQVRSGCHQWKPCRAEVGKA